MFGTFFLNRAVYEKMRENIVEPERPQLTKWRMRIVCWMTKATHSEYVIINAFRRLKWLQECASTLPYTYIGSLVCSVTDTWK